MAERKEIGPFVELPNTQEHWLKLRVGLTDLAEKKVKGLEVLEEILAENDHGQAISTPLSLLRKVLSDGSHFTEEVFCETLLPWIAGKALQVEELFKESGYKLPASRILFIPDSTPVAISPSECLDTYSTPLKW